MAAGDSPIAKVNKQRTSYAETKRELARSKKYLSAALGQLIGTKVAVEGYPTSARYNQTPDPLSGKSRRVSIPVYRLFAPEDERQPVTCEGVILGADNISIEIGNDPPETEVGRRYSYMFNVADLVRLSPIETESQ